MRVNKEQLLTIILSWFLISFLIGKILLTNIGIGALIIYWFFDKEALKKTIDVLKTPEFWGISILFWLTMLGLTYTELAHQSTGWKYVERRLGLLIFPLILGTVYMPAFTIEVIKKIAIISIPIIGIIGFGYSYYNFSLTANDTFFYNNNLLTLFGHQAVYFALYINVVLTIASRDIINTRTSKEQVFYFVFLLFCLVFEYYLASRISLVICVIITVLIIYHNLKRYLGSRVYIILGLILAALCFGFVKYSGSTLDRFKSLQYTEYDITSIEEEYNFGNEGKQSNWNGITLRLAIWKCASELIIDHPILGVGTGDYKTELHKYYKKNGFEYGIMKGYTTHNQYIYLLVAFGAVGLVIFLLFQFWLLISNLKKEDKRLVYLFVVFWICFLTENILNRNQGIITFSFFASLLIQPSKI